MQREDIKNLYNNIVNSLCKSLDKKNNHTWKHSEKVAQYAVLLSKEFGLNWKELTIIGWGASLHDIGKIGISEYILDKPSKLTKEEFKEIQLHPVYSKEILSEVFKNTDSIFNVMELLLITEIASLHHERWDGNGYPYGLKGEEIPIMCRIISLADSWDAMTSDRSYRKSLSREQAIEEIRINSGTQFDPTIVNIFLKCIEKSLI